MGLLSALGITSNNKSVKAQYAPAVMQSFGYGPGSIGSGYGYSPIDRSLAMQVPAVARCRNLIAGVISYLPLELYKKSTGQELKSPLWLEQPDIRQPRSVTISATCDSLIFYGVAFWLVTEVYADDLRPSRFEWVSNSMNLFYQFILPKPSQVEPNKADMEAIRKIIIEGGHIDA